MHDREINIIESLKFLPANLCHCYVLLLVSVMSWFSGVNAVCVRYSFSTTSFFCLDCVTAQSWVFWQKLSSCVRAERQLKNIFIAMDVTPSTDKCAYVFAFLGCE